jgi:hypothetical protein
MEGHRTFNLASRSATIPVERHRVTRLAGESELRLLQQPISAARSKAKFADFPLQFPKRFFWGGRRLLFGGSWGRPVWDLLDLVSSVLCNCGAQRCLPGNSIVSNSFRFLYTTVQDDCLNYTKKTKPVSIKY